MGRINPGILLSAGVLGAAAFSASLVQAQAPGCSAQSPDHRVAVLELYTSEGCSSCPPADRFLSALPASGFSGDRVLPLAFHVDYWDYIGWKDRFAQPGFTKRQKRMATLNGLATIYTPQYLVDGKDVRGWFASSAIKKAIEAVNQSEPTASIDLEVMRLTQAEIELSATVTTPDPAHRQDTVVYLVIYENALGSEVKRGENAGKRLQHDYVVRRLTGPVRADMQRTTEIRQTIPLHQDWVRDHLGVAVFVQNRVSGEVLQALQLQLPCA